MTDLLDKRAYSRFAVGDYLLIPDSFANFFIPTRSRNEPVPKPLQGRWTSAADFRRAAEEFHGAEYSVEGLKGRNKRIAEEAADGN